MSDRVAGNIQTRPKPLLKTSPQEHLLQRACACGQHTPAGGDCPSCKQQPTIASSRSGAILARQAFGTTGTTSANVNRILASSGRPLDSALQQEMEQHFGYDFSQVRVHSDADAGQSAQDVRAHAYTVGHNIVFGTGQFAPHTHAGRHLLAHELAHVIQQDGSTPTAHLEISNPHSPAEHEATSIADQFPPMTPSQGKQQPIPHPLRVTHPAIMRSPIFDSTMEICHHLLKSRVFHVSQGGIVVTAHASWEASPDWRGAEPPSCGHDMYNMTLTRVAWPFDSEVANCEFQNGRSVSKNWTGLPEDDYYLTIWTNNTNPNCCLRGEISVSQESGLNGSSCSGDIATLSTGEKIGKAIELSAGKLGGETGKRISELLTPKSIAIMVAFTGAYVFSQTTPVGWLADIIVVGLIAATVWMLGQEAIEIIKLLIEFFKTASEATNEEGIDHAAVLFAQAITKVGVDIIVAILFHKAGKAANLTPPGPRSPGLIEVLQIEGGKLKTTLLDQQAYANYATENGAVIRVVEKIPDSTLMMENQNTGGSSPKTSGSRTGSTESKVTEPTSSKGRSDLPGKDTIAGGGVAKQRPAPPEQSPSAPTENESTRAQKESGEQQERRLLREDRASGRAANSATYHVYEGGKQGSFSQWLSNLQNHIKKTFQEQVNQPALNDKPLGENTYSFIQKYPNLKAAWKKMNLGIDTQLKSIQTQKFAAEGDQVRIRELLNIEKKLEAQRAELAEFEAGNVGNKRPDLVELFFAERRAIVTDITQRTGDPLHNFKTAFYIEVLKAILGWSDVNGVNFNTVYDQNITP